MLKTICHRVSEMGSAMTRRAGSGKLIWHELVDKAIVGCHFGADFDRTSADTTLEHSAVLASKSQLRISFCQLSLNYHNAKRLCKKEMWRYNI